MGRLTDNEIASAILLYLRDNPAGMDTVEGIARFWLLRQKIESDIVDVRKVLANLVEKGYLEQIRLSTGAGQTIEEFYRLDATNLPEIMDMIDSSRKEV